MGPEADLYKGSKSGGYWSKCGALGYLNRLCGIMKTVVMGDLF